MEQIPRDPNVANFQTQSDFVTAICELGDGPISKFSDRIIEDEKNEKEKQLNGVIIQCRSV